MFKDFLIDPISTLISLISFIVALSFHEFAHAFVADKCGDQTAKNLGRMTLNPIPHIDPIGLICIMLVGFGWAKPVPINPNNFGKTQRDTILVSLAGVCMNFIFAVISIFILVVSEKIFRSMSLGKSPFFDFLFTFAFTNIILMVFNLLPIPRFDGYNVLKTFLYGKVDWQIFGKLEHYYFAFLIAFIAINNRTSFLSNIASGIFNTILVAFARILGV